MQAVQVALLELWESMPERSGRPALELGTRRSRISQQAQEAVVEAADWTEMCFVDEAGRV